MKSYGLQAFSVTAPTSVSIFKTKIKTFLFNRAFTKP